MKRFKKKVGFITGAASGIGQQTALRLAREGASLYLTDLNEEGLKETAIQCAELGAEVKIKKLDISIKEDVNSAINDCIVQFGRMDVLLNIAGVLLLEHFEKTTKEQFDFLINVNVLGTFLTCQAAIPHLIKSGGNIVNCSSVSALAGQAYASIYGASKGAVSALTRGLAVEYAKKGLRCNTIIPGPVATPMIAQPKAPSDMDSTLMGRMSPIDGNFASPDKITGAIAMLASDDGSYINGAEIRVDGGGLS